MKNRIDKIKAVTEAYLRSPSGVKRQVFRANAPEYITYLLQHVAELKSEMDLVKEELFYEKRASEENHAKYVEQYKLVELLQKEVEFWKLAVDIKKGDNIKLISILHEKDEKAREAINKWETATPEDDFDDIMHAVIDTLREAL